MKQHAAARQRLQQLRQELEDETEARACSGVQLTKTKVRCPPPAARRVVADRLGWPVQAQVWRLWEELQVPTPARLALCRRALRSAPASNAVRRLCARELARLRTGRPPAPEQQSPTAAVVAMVARAGAGAGAGTAASARNGHVRLGSPGLQ